MKMNEEVQRWTAKPKSALVLDIIQGKTENEGQEYCRDTSNVYLAKRHMVPIGTMAHENLQPLQATWCATSHFPESSARSLSSGVPWGISVLH